MPTPIFVGYPTPPLSVTEQGISLAVPEPLEYGTINLGGRRPVKISISEPYKLVPLAQKRGVNFEWGTVLSATVGPLDLARFPQKVMVLLPLLDIEKFVILTEAQALAKFLNDGLHLGIFDTRQVSFTVGNKTKSLYGATIYAMALSAQEGRRVEIYLRDDPTLDDRRGQDYSTSSQILNLSDSKFISDVFRIAGMDPETEAFMSGRLLGLSVSYSMSLTTEINAQFDDRNYDLTNGGYFDPRREYVYRGLLFEVVSCESSPGSAGYPQANVSLAPKGVQEMRRDKSSQSISAVNGFEYARRVAARLSMNFVGEQNSKAQAVFKGKGQNADESAWTVLTNLAADGQFFVFEVDNTLVFASGQFLMWKFGLDEKKNKKGVIQKYLDLRYVPSLINNGAIEQNGKMFELSTWPTIRVSENDGLEGTGSCEVLSPNGRLIRPGHTIYLTTIPNRFVAGYLVQDVNYSEFTNEPVSLGLLMLQKPKNQDKPDKDK